MATKTKVSKVKSQEKKAKKSGLSIRRMKKALEKKFATDSFWTPENGVNKLRLLPLPNETEVFWVQVDEAYIPTADGKGKQRFVSPTSADPEAYCPISAASKALFRAGQKDLSNDIRVSNKYFCNAMVLNKNDEWEYKPVKLAYQVWRDLVEHCVEEAEERDLSDDELLESSSLLDPQEGKIITIRKREVNKRVEYKTTVTNESVPIEDEWLENCQDFASETKASSVDEIEKALCDYLDIDDISDITGASTKQTKKTSSTKASKKSAPVDDDDDDDEEEDDDDLEDEDDAEDDEEDGDEDDSEEDDDEEEDDEDEPPFDEDDEEEDEEPKPKSRGKATVKVKAAAKRRK